MASVEDMIKKLLSMGEELLSIGEEGEEEGDPGPPKPPVMPYPEVLRFGRGGQGWTVRPSTDEDPAPGMTDLEKRQMAIPREEDDHDRGIRAHEMLHGQWTADLAQRKRMRRRGDPEKTDGWEQLAEEARIMAIHHRLGLPPPMPNRPFMAETNGEAIFQAISVIGTPRAETILDEAEKIHRGLEAVQTSWNAARDQHKTRPRGQYSEHEQTCRGHCDYYPPKERPKNFDMKVLKKAFNFTTKAYNDLPELGNPDDWVANSTDEGRSYRWSMNLARRLRQELKVELPPFAPCMLSPGDMAQPGDDGDDGSGWLYDGPPGRPPHGVSPWGKMEIVEYELTEKVVDAYDMRTRPQEEGVIVTRPDRWAIDRRIFGVKRRVWKQGGTALIDLSGSMGWDWDELFDLVPAIPAGMIGAYSGRDRTGALAIIADKGRRYAGSISRVRVGGNNVVDGPALEWLARQPAPRIWISDGYATGTGDAANSWHFKEARLIAQRCRAARVRYIEDAVKLFKSGRKFFPPSYVENADPDGDYA